MKKIIIMLLAIAAAFTGQAAAQGPVEMIAYDRCAPDEWYTVYCYMYLTSVGAVFENGFDPAWSPDGSRFAFVRYDEPGLFVLNLGDWSVASVHPSGGSPAWSRDGAKLAFSDGELYAMGTDGSNVVQLTNNVGFRGQPAWSPDGGTIAFDCEVEVGNLDVCAINRDGTGFRRLTFDPAWDSGAAFSPDGFAIAFSTGRYGPYSSQIAIMNVNGSGVGPMGAEGYQPAWSPDGTRIAFVEPQYRICNAQGDCPFSIYVMNRDGSERRWIAYGTNPAWALSVRPVAWYVSQCDGLICAFDGLVPGVAMAPS